MGIIDRVKEVLEKETYIDQRDGDNIGYEIYQQPTTKVVGL